MRSTARRYALAPRSNRGEVGGFATPDTYLKPLTKETPQVQMPSVIMLGKSQFKAHSAAMTRQNILVTGPGGTGKSELMNQVIKDFRLRQTPVAVTASTGVAALRVGGSTIHSFLGTNICGNIDQLRKAYTRDEIHLNGDRYSRLLEAEVIIVDEVSMLTGDYIDMMDYHLRDITSIEEPFGGKQMIFCGDFLQLPPVVKNRRGVSTHFAFQAEAWKDASVKRMTLNENFRQTDVEFRKHLDAIRFGDLPPKTRDFLRESVQRPLDVEEPMRLYPLNRRVDALNKKKLAGLVTPTREYRAHFTGNQRLWQTLEKHCLVPAKLHLKTGARVMLCKNDYQEGYRNGQRGVLVDHTESGDWGDRLFVELDGGGEVRVDPHCFEWKNDKGDILATMEQYPIKLAWAVTIHKSQGQTLDNVICDLRGVFEHGQCYVALSRVRSETGLSLVSAITRRQVRAHSACVEYYPRVRRRR